tara:strand:+ start:84 stop:572 length:489 start_codon:yes stop_codon:yes gene_type:complete
LLQKFKIKENKSTNKIKNILFFSKPISNNKPLLCKKNKTIKVYPISNPLRPSIKFEPFINIKIQNDEKKYPKNKFSNNISKKSSLEESILISSNVTNDSIKIICIKILILGEANILVSDKKPTVKINRENKISKLYSIINDKIGYNKRNPPMRGMFLSFKYI